MDRGSYLEALAADSGLLADAAVGYLAEAVPHCPGWTVRDVVVHVCEVYEHKIAAVERQGERPDPWPPVWPEDRDPLAWFADARERLLNTLSATDPASPAWTWWPPDQTAGFWVRRMAHETAVHRIDVQAAAGVAAPVAVDLALDGIDEILLIMLAGDWSTEPQPDLTGTVDVATGDRAWAVAMTPAEVTVDGRGGTTPDAIITGEPSPLLLWLWGRARASAVEVTGDRRVAERLRERLVLATQ